MDFNIRFYEDRRVEVTKIRGEKKRYNCKSYSYQLQGIE